MNRKKKGPTKPRSTIITLDMGVPTVIKSGSVSADGSFDLFDENGKRVNPVDVRIERSYERTKGPKTLSRIPLRNQLPATSDPSEALFRYDTVFAIDANTRSINGHEISVAAFVLGKWKEPRVAPQVMRYTPVFGLEFHDADCHPDLLALKHLIMQMEANPESAAAGKMGVIIDSHLGSLPKIASRQIPILDDCYLPGGMDLIYASDAAQDSLVNILLRTADRTADGLLGHIEAGGGHPDSQIVDPDHSSYFRVWNYGKL